MLDSFRGIVHKFQSLKLSGLLVTGSIPDWWQWGFWVSPLSYGFNAFTVNEMFAPRWMNKFVSSLPPSLGFYLS